MKPAVICLILALVLGPGSMIAQGPAESSSSNSDKISTDEESAVTLSRTTGSETFVRPFSRGASTESVSTLGGQFQIATNLNRHMNLRSNYNFLVWKKWVTYGGYTSHVPLNMLSTNLSLDVYPFPSHGLRFSPGLLIHNPLLASADIPLTVQGGSFTLNGHTYTSSKRVDVYEGLQSRRAALTMTTGWGNMIPRNTGRWSFPVEIGAAFLGEPAVEFKGIDGEICDSQGSCISTASSTMSLMSPAELKQKMPALLNDLNAHFGSYSSRMPLLKTYPIISVGLAYKFHLRTERR